MAFARFGKCFRNTEKWCGWNGELPFIWYSLVACLERVNLLGDGTSCCTGTSRGSPATFPCSPAVLWREKFMDPSGTLCELVELNRRLLCAISGSHRYRISQGLLLAEPSCLLRGITKEWTVCYGVVRGDCFSQMCVCEIIGADEKSMAPLKLRLWGVSGATSVYYLCLYCFLIIFLIYLFIYLFTYYLVYLFFLFYFFICIYLFFIYPYIIYTLPLYLYLLQDRYKCIRM